MEIASKKPRRVLSVFVLAMLNVSIMASLRNLPLVAEYGLSAISYFLIVALLFLVPSALISAELATGWSKGGGVYIWVKEALGDRWGFFAVWMQWVHNVSWYPVILSFVASTLAYVIDPKITPSKGFVLAVILGSFWGMTLLNYLGIKTSSVFSTIGVILGTLIPGVFIIFLGLRWFFSDQPSHLIFSWENVLPKFEGIGNWVFLGGLFLAFAGLEVSSAHAANVQNPQKSLPRSILLAALITFFIFMLGALSIAIVIPKEQISLVAGLMDAFGIFFNSYHMAWILPLTGFLLILGAIAEVNAWIAGPVKGLYATSIHGNLPPIFQKLNKHGTPTNLLLFQAIIVSLASFVFLYMPTLSSSYWILSAMSAQIYLIMYILMFIAAIRLRYTKPHVPRAYKIPYQHKGIWFTASVGIFGSLAAIALAFFPPSQIVTGSLLFYDSFLVIGLFIMCAIPLIIYQCKKPHWFIPK